MIEFPDGRERNWEALERRLGYRFLDKRLLCQAFVHSSCTANNHIKTYERLEFLGDRVFGLAVGYRLFQEFWQKSEGELSSFMSMIVNNRSLGKLAKRMGLDDYLFLSPGEEKNGGRVNHYILADVLEAVVGAIFIDGGWNQVMRFLERQILSQIHNIISQEQSDFNPKGKLQQLTQEKFKAVPKYRVSEETREESNQLIPWYVVEVYLEGVMIGKAEGKIKHDVGIEAAANTLKETKNLSKLPLSLLKKRDIFREILFEERRGEL